MNINWIILIVGGLFETGFAISLGKAQQTSGREMWLWLFAFIVCVSISMYLLFRAMGGEKAIPVGTAYAVWGAIGAIGTVIAGIILFKEPVSRIADRKQSRIEKSVSKKVKSQKTSSR